MGRRHGMRVWKSTGGRGGKVMAGAAERLFGKYHLDPDSSECTTSRPCKHNDNHCSLAPDGTENSGND